MVDTKFVNNFGDKGASISMNEGGGLFCKNCEFIMDSSYGDHIRHFNTSSPNQAMLKKGDLLKSQYKSDLPQNFLIDETFFEDEIKLIKNVDG